MTFEELKRYDRTPVTYMSLEGMLYVHEDEVYLLNESAKGACPNFSDEWKSYGYKYSWFIHPDFYGCIKPSKPVDFNKIDEILRR